MRLTSSLLLASLAATSAWAAPKCNADTKCPEEWPCCSEYGECGTGGFCLGGCDPLFSFSTEACTPEPVCESKSYSWDNLDNAILTTKYLGDASKDDWVYSGDVKLEDGNLLLTMPKNSAGTLVANNHYIWYGKISAKVKSSRGAGVVTGFILLGDTKDEIDLEFVGADLANVQTNYYFQGVLDYNNGANASVPGGDTFNDWHEYTIDWKPESITWSVDGEVKRTLERDSTWNDEKNRYDYPQTPMRMQLSLWPAGQASNAAGTVAWAGGAIDWNSQDIQEKGYYYATFSEISVECYDPPQSSYSLGSKSYIFIDENGVESSVRVTDNSTVLASLGATGLDMDLGGDDSSSNSDTSTSIPESHGGSGNEPGNQGSSGSSSSSDSSSSSSGFSQGNSDSGSTGSNGASSPNERVMRGSFFAVLVAIVVLVTL
ncbi:carbohydrate-binding module family 18 [Aspergillus ambiguus]|uniref:putative cell wall glucanase (Utr2) n=1 Tax=Aspergillus ambiguus TaxID=176160 RepID=UPI003CCE318C